MTINRNPKYLLNCSKTFASILGSQPVVKAGLNCAPAVHRQGSVIFAGAQCLSVCLFVCFSSLLTVVVNPTVSLRGTVCCGSVDELFNSSPSAHLALPFMFTPLFCHYSTVFLLLREMFRFFFYLLSFCRLFKNFV